MSDRDLLLSVVLDQPEEDTPRLALADCVFEQGDYKLAALIRERVPCLYCQTQGHVEPPFHTGEEVGNAGVQLDPDRCKCRNCEGTGWIRRCEHDGCRAGGHPCFLPEQDDPDGYYCGNHSHEHGFCCGCGMFYAGIESFDFNRSGLCDECQDSVDADFDDGDDF